MKINGEDVAKEDFYSLVFEICRMIPKGRVSTYGAIANALGIKGSARMVGWAMNASHSHHFMVPAHRVVNSKGLLSGKAHFPPPSKMQELLEEEGIQLVDDKIIDFKKHFWDPLQEL